MSIETEPSTRNQEYERRLKQIRESAKKCDVTFDLERWFLERMQNNDPELLEIQKQGRISEALQWLRSTTPEGMQFGTDPREKRIEKAQRYAELTGTTIEEIAREHNIELNE